MSKQDGFRWTRNAAFTLVEIVTVLALIGLLTAIILPAISVAQRAVARSKTKAQLHQYLLAYESFRAEYGYYPTFGSQSAKFALKGNNEVYIETFSGRSRSGGEWGNPYAKQANPRRLVFYQFGESEFATEDSANTGELVDAFGNPNFVVIVDQDGNGLIEANELMAIPAADRPNGIHAGVVIYLDNSDNNPDWSWIYSWE